MEKAQLITNILFVIGIFWASIVALAIALFGKEMENAIYRPQITIKLRNTEGEETTNKYGRIRYYHLFVENKSSRIAHNAVPI